MGRSHRRLLWLFGTIGLTTGSCVSGQTTTTTPVAPTTVAQAVTPKSIELLVATRMRNTTEPCGCTSTPLGDIARIAALVKQAPESSLLLDAGGLRYEPKSLPPSKQAQGRLKADFIENTWQELSALVMVQPEDLLGPQGPSELAGHRRLVANLTGLPSDATVPREIRTRLGLRLGVIGIADPGATWPTGITVSDPATALGQQLQFLRTDGVDAVIVLTGLPREKVRRLAQKFPEVKLWVAGVNDLIEDGVELPEIFHDALILTPAHKGERLFRVSLYPSALGKLVWKFVATGKQRQKQIAALQERTRAAEKLLTGLAKDPTADPAFVSTQKTELDGLQKQLAELSKAPQPSDGYLTAELIPVTRSLPRDPVVRKRIDELDQKIGQANLTALTGPPPDTLPGSPRYVGTTDCLGACHFHEPAHKLWQATQHGSAFRTLVQVGKELSYDCVGCHATAFDTPAGSNLLTLFKWQQATTPPLGVGPDLRHVGCEVCHGPGSLHIAAPGKVKIPIPRPDVNTCLGCHTKEHSDTFEWNAYARGILGEGHGAATRQTLGSGPTGRELRQAARKQAAEH